MYKFYVVYYFQKSFIQRNISNLLSMKAGDILIDICLDLPHLSKYIQKYKETVQVGKFSLPASHSEATVVKHK